MRDKIANLKDNDVIEVEKSVIEKALNDELNAGIEKGKIEAKKDSIGIYKTHERQNDNPNKLGNFFWHLGKNGLIENQPVLMDFKHTEKSFNMIGEKIFKSMSVTDFGAGGAYIPESMSADLIPYLRNASVVRLAGAQTRPMPQGNLTVRKNTGGSIAYWEGELQTATPSAISTGVHKMSAKKLICLVPVSNSLLRYAGDFAFANIQADMVAAVAAKEDETFLVSAGTEYSPKGLIGYAHTSNVNAQTGTPDTTKKRADIIKAIGLVAGANVPVNRPSMFIDSRAKYDLMAAVDSNSTTAFPTLAQNILFGANVFETNALAATSTSRIIFSQIGHAIIGQTMNMQVEFIPNAAYVNGSGSVVAGTSTDESVFRIILEEDFYMPYEKGSAVITGVTWGV